MNSTSPRRAGLPRIALRIGLLVGALVLLHYGARWVLEAVEVHFMPWYDSYGVLALLLVAVVYVVALATPFVPGIEISLMLLMMLGEQGVALVYGSTLAALSISFIVGRMIPVRVIGRLFGWLHLQRAHALLERLEPLGPDARLQLLLESAPVRILPFLLRHRYLAVAVAFNVPGNALIGGGGGIGLVAGMSGLFRFPAYVVMVCLAIAPIPLMVLAKGYFVGPS